MHCYLQLYDHIDDKSFENLKREMGKDFFGSWQGDQ